MERGDKRDRSCRVGFELVENPYRDTDPSIRYLDKLDSYSGRTATLGETNA